MKIRPRHNGASILLAIVLGIVVLAVGGCAAVTVIRCARKHLKPPEPQPQDTNTPPDQVPIPTNAPPPEIRSDTPPASSGSSIVVLWSTNLESWEAIGAILETNLDGSLTITDTNETYSPLGFYRLMSRPQ